MEKYCYYYLGCGKNWPGPTDLFEILRSNQNLKAILNTLFEEVTKKNQSSLTIAHTNTRVLYIHLHSVKSVQIRSFFWSVFSCIQSEYRNIPTRKNSVFGHFSRSVEFNNFFFQVFFKKFFSSFYFVTSGYRTRKGEVWRVELKHEAINIYYC